MPAEAMNTCLLPLADSKQVEGLLCLLHEPQPIQSVQCPCANWNQCSSPAKVVVTGVASRGKAGFQPLTQAPGDIGHTQRCVGMWAPSYSTC